MVQMLSCISVTHYRDMVKGARLCLCKKGQGAEEIESCRRGKEESREGNECGEFDIGGGRGQSEGKGHEGGRK